MTINTYSGIRDIFRTIKKIRRYLYRRLGKYENTKIDTFVYVFWISIRLEHLKRYLRRYRANDDKSEFNVGT